LGLTAGPVPKRVDAHVKAGLLVLIDHAGSQGWTRRRAAIRLGLDDSRLQRWDRLRDTGQSLADAPGGGNPVHGILEFEREEIIVVFERWAEIDRSHRKLAHRGSRLGQVHVSESTFLRVLRSEQLIPPGNPVRVPVPRKAWPDWLVWKPNHIWGYDFTHFMRARRVVIAVLDIVSRKWLSTVVSAEETSSQIEVAFTDALETEDLLETAWAHGSAELRAAMARGDRETLERLTTSGDIPLLLTISDNGPQMRSVTTREFMAGVAIAQQFGRPYTPTDQAWIESLFGHIKAEWPHLEHIRDPGELEIELERVRLEYNSVRLHESLGYVTPDDEHEGRGEGIRQARVLGLRQARQARIHYRRNYGSGKP
jgi:putative transposase